MAADADDSGAADVAVKELEGTGRVRFLPALDFSSDKEEEKAAEGKLTLPCFPLGRRAYVPDHEEVLNIFEPRYREMYSDILFSGGRRFVVPQLVQDDSGGVRLSEVGVVFYLKDLKEVSEQTNDRVKYVCQHVLIGRVTLQRVLNPRAFADRTTYLRVECEDLVDEDEGADCEALEIELTEKLKQVAEAQQRADAEVTFPVQEVEQMNATRGAGFWGVVSHWQTYLDSRMVARQRQFEQGVRTKIIEYFQREGKAIPQSLMLQELPTDVQRDFLLLQKQFQEEAEALEQAQSSSVQELVQTSSHTERLRMLSSMLEQETKRLDAKQALNSLLAESNGGDASTV